MTKKRNILFIIADQHHAGMLGCMGHPVVQTPNIDRIAANGVVCEGAYTISPICSPSRISIYTGKTPATTGYYGNCNWPDQRERPDYLPTVLRKNGYQTRLIGRSHMVKKWDQEGFEKVSYVNFADSDRYDLSDNPWLMHLIEHGAVDEYDFALPMNVTKEGGFTSSMPQEHCEEEWIASEVVQFLQERDRERPFYLHVGYDHPHDPIAPPENFDRLYSAEDVVLSDNYNDSFEGKPSWIKDKRFTPGGYPYTPRDEAHLKWLVAKQYALVSLIDHSIGKILAELERQGELENTLIIYTSDHGDFAGEHGMVLKNLGIYEPVHRSPLILSCPGKLPAGKKTKEFMQLHDLYPTILAHADIEVPDCDGIDMTPVLIGKKQGRAYVLGDWEDVRAIRTDRYRLVTYKGQNFGELYDHSEDPGEQHNLWNSAKHAAIREQLQGKLQESIPDEVNKISSFLEERQGKSIDWFREDSVIHAMWKYGLKWSDLKPYMEHMPDGTVRLTEEAAKLSEKYPFQDPHA